MTTKKFIPGNWTDYIPVVGFIFACGIFYSGQLSMADEIGDLEKDKVELQNEIEDVKNYFTSKLQKKIDVQNKQEQRIQELEKYRAWEEGYNKAKKDYENK